MAEDWVCLQLGTYLQLGILRYFPCFLVKCLAEFSHMMQSLVFFSTYSPFNGVWIERLCSLQRALSKGKRLQKYNVGDYLSDCYIKTLIQSSLALNCWVR